MIKTLFIVLLLLLVCLQPAHSQGKETDTRVVSYDSFFDLLNATGSVNPELYVYDFTDETRAHLGDKIFLHDIYDIPSGWAIYQELIGFYELIGRNYPSQIYL